MRRAFAVLATLLQACPFPAPPPGACDFSKLTGCRPEYTCRPDGGCGAPCNEGAVLTCAEPAPDGGQDYAGVRTCGDAGVFGACVVKRCQLSEGVCADARQRVGDVEGCGAPSYGSQYEPTETCRVADRLDNDCDGYIDEVEDGGAPIPCGVGLCLAKDGRGRFKAYRTCGGGGCSVPLLTAAFGSDGYSQFDLCRISPTAGLESLDSNCDGEATLASRPFVLLRGVTEGAVVANDALDQPARYFVAAVRPSGGAFELALHDFDPSLVEVTLDPGPFGQAEVAPVWPVLSSEVGPLLQVAYRKTASSIAVTQVRSDQFRGGLIPTIVDAGEPIVRGPHLAALNRSDAGVARSAVAYQTATGFQQGLIWRPRPLVAGEFRFGPQTPVPATTVDGVGFWGNGRDDATMAGCLSAAGARACGLLSVAEAVGQTTSLTVTLLADQVVSAAPFAIAGGRGSMRAGLFFTSVSPTVHFPIYALQRGTAYRVVVAKSISELPAQNGAVVVGESDATGTDDGGLSHLPPALAFVRNGTTIYAIPAVNDGLRVQVMTGVVGDVSATWSPADPRFALVTAPVQGDAGVELEARFVCMPPQRPVN